MKLLITLITLTLSLAAHADGPYADRDIYQVGIRHSVAKTPERVASAVASATFHVGTSKNCSVEARLFAIRDGSFYPSSVFSDPVLLGMEYQIWIEGMDHLDGRTGKITRYCTTQKEQEDALEEALAKTWYADQVYEVVKTQAVSTPGVRVGN
jgi:formylmethanofuran:tetrahydromethanopterin formyltransferase